ncbi:MAG: PAS domain-containing protein [Cyanobacteria bacterium]|nr:PAS domain-containing protein [Cyanobacteriota bacterium]
MILPADSIANDSEYLLRQWADGRPPNHVVGIGASAGGLAALKVLLAQLKLQGRMAYVVAQHLAPDHPSLIVELLQRVTPLQVVTAVDGDLLRPGVVAVAPSNRDVAVRGDRLVVSDPPPRFGPSPSIDRLFESIAREWRQQGVAVVLSGTGSDGARGLAQVRAAGGLTFAQLPETARFDAMPRAAISLGGARKVLETGAIGQQLNSVAESTVSFGTAGGQEMQSQTISAVLGHLKQGTGVDFSQYKESTLRRQLQRRMAIRQVADLDDYVRLLRDDAEEAPALLHNLLVNVTAFFRDPEAFDVLAQLLKDYLAPLVPQAKIRVWVPGCSTGKEVYTLAMVISQVLDHPVVLADRLKIFGTDLDEEALAVARRGVYSLTEAQAIPADLRRRFLEEEGDEFTINDQLRGCVVFARHNVSEDPPFPRLDLISCRNTLIYFTPPLQERVISLFLFGLLPGGLLFLGESESLGHGHQGFAVANATHRIYRRSGEVARRTVAPLGSSASRGAGARPSLARGTVLRDSVPEQHMTLLEALSRSFCGDCLVLDDSHNLVQVIGDVTPYCVMPEGWISANASLFLRPELRDEARALLLLVRAEEVPVLSPSISLPGEEGSLRLEVRPLRVETRNFCVITFMRVADTDTDATIGPRTGSGTRLIDSSFGSQILRLEEQLLASQDSLRRSMVELEEANEELEASSEELQASSEELQSSNEELEASNEELQATNEELGTLNQQLRSRSEELQLLNNDLENIQSSLSQGMVIVDLEMRITRFTPLAVRVFALVESDIGQPLLSVPTTLKLTGLRQAIVEVLAGVSRRNIEASSEEVAYLLQVMPYLDRDRRPMGAIITLTDLGELVALRRTAEAALDDFTRLTDSLEQAVWKRNGNLDRLLYISAPIQTLTGWTPAELCSQPSLLEESIEPADRPRVAASRTKDSTGWTVAYRLGTRDGHRIQVVETATVIKGDHDHCVVGTLTDVTETTAVAKQAADLSTIFASVFHSQCFDVVVLDDSLKVLMANERLCARLVQAMGSLVGLPFQLFLTPSDGAALLELARRPASGVERTESRDLQLLIPHGQPLAMRAEIAGLSRPLGAAVMRLILVELPAGSA